MPAEEEEAPRARSSSRSRSSSRAKEPAEAAEKPVERPEREAPPETPRSENPRPRKSGSDGAKVVGMGDHMPSFIALSFEERRT